MRAANPKPHTVAKALEYVMPAPPPVVLWRNAPGGDTAYAVVTKRNKHSVSLMLFPPDSRVGVPKDGVRFIDDPWNKTHGINADSGVWEYTDETKLLHKLEQALLANPGDAVA